LPDAAAASAGRLTSDASRTVTAMTDRPLTLMAVHAHPDDEATTTGGTLARYAAEGIRTVLVVCTDGAQGDGPDGVKPGEPGHDTAAVAELRRVELEASCRALKVAAVEMLGYADSGMMGWPTNDVANSFWQTPVPEAAARLAALMEQYRPDVVVTYDENGFYGHPDHVRAHQVTMEAWRRSAGEDWAPKKLYLGSIPRSAMQMFQERMRELQAEQDVEGGPPEDDGAGVELGQPDERFTTTLDVAPWFERKFDALRCHQTQVPPDSWFFTIPEEWARLAFSTEWYILADARVTTEPPETDLFAGLR
jgi:LmbE family N-acetylglucosaminyl deacetylase